MARWDKFPGRRAFKSHMSADKFTYPPFVKQIIVIREGKEVMNSMLPFINGISEEWRNLWGGLPRPTSHEQIIDFFSDEFFGYIL